MALSPTPTRVAAALATARTMGLDRLDAQLLLAHVLERSRTWLITHDDAALTLAQAEAFDGLCQRRADAVPVAYLLGTREFHGLTLHVGPDVLVPRPDTETLVAWALDLLPGLTHAPDGRPRLLDLGTGSGAIALALAQAWPEALVCATDASGPALEIARGNAQRLGLPVDLRQGSWWQALPPGAEFDLVVSNPPYIAADDPHLPALRHEPLAALSPGGDGLGALREIISDASRHLAPEGWLLLEHGWDQADAVAAMLGQAGFIGVCSRHDLAGHTRCTGGQRPPRALADR